LVCNWFANRPHALKADQCSTTIQAAEKKGTDQGNVLTHRLTAFSPIRVSRAWSPCRAPGLGLEQELVALRETVPVETLRLFQTIAEPVLGHLALSRRELGEGP
jgi:hypothetical protein